MTDQVVGDMTEFVSTTETTVSLLSTINVTTATITKFEIRQMRHGL